MFASRVFRVVVLLAILAGTMSLGVNPAQAAPPPPELQDPETACVEYFGGKWLGGGDCFFGPPDFFPFFLISQGIYWGGYQAFWNDFIAEFGCSPGSGVVMPMVKEVFGPGPRDFVYFPDETASAVLKPPMKAWVAVPAILTKPVPYRSSNRALASSSTMPAPAPAYAR